MSAKDNLKEFPRIARLTPEEQGTVISLLVQYENRVQLVRDDFQYIYDKKISSKTVKLIAELFKEEIEKKIQELLRETLMNPLASRNYRFKLLWGIFKRAWQVKKRGKMPTGKGTYEDKICDDPTTQLRVLDLAEKMEIGPVSLEIKRAQVSDLLPQGVGDEDEMEMDDGLSVG